MNSAVVRIPQVIAAYSSAPRQSRPQRLAVFKKAELGGSGVHNTLGVCSLHHADSIAQGKRDIIVARAEARPSQVPDSCGISPVEVRVYDIDRYGLAPLASKVLMKKVDGIYHVAIAVYGVEYWYDHQINQVDLSEVEYCHGFGPCNTYDLGYTNMPREEFEEWLYSEIKDEYTIDKYDCFYHNCHHFADQLAKKLTDGRIGIPQWCIDHGEKGLEALPSDRADLYRTASNKIARIMMLAWGRYNQQRFKDHVEKEADVKNKSNMNISV